MYRGGLASGWKASFRDTVMIGEKEARVMEGEPLPKLSTRPFVAELALVDEIKC